MRFLSIPLAIATLVLLPACGTSKDDSAVALGDDALVSFQFLDASVPPQYHRSVELTVTAATSRLVIDSYGDVLAEEKITTDPEVWRDLGATLGQVTDLAPDASAEGCTGGTVTTLTVVEGSDSLVDVVLDECGGANEAAADRVDQWIAPALAQFPTIEELAPEGP